MSAVGYMAHVAKAWRLLCSRFLSSEIELIHDFHKPPYGGGNQFMLALKAEMKNRGLDVGSNRIGPRTKAVLFNFFNFDFNELRAMHRPGVRMVHRVDGPVSIYRGKDEGIDRRICEINRQLAHATVFQSRYSMERNQELGYEFVNPAVIHNASDPAIFHARGRISPPSGGRVKLISTSWSDNPRKGLTIYQWLDAHLDFNRYEYTFVGNCQARFKRIRQLPAVASVDLADLLRQHHIFITPSQFESCSNALVEALTCGLPSIYHLSGSNAELVKDAGLGFSTAEEIPVLLDALVSDYQARHSRIQAPTISDVADQYLAVLGITQEVTSA